MALWGLVQVAVYVLVAVQGSVSPLWIRALWIVALAGAAFIGFMRSRRDLLYLLLWLEIGWLFLAIVERSWQLPLESLGFVAIIGALWATRDRDTMTPLAEELRAASIGLVSAAPFIVLLVVALNDVF
jgi:hypothetical protein